ncbi:DUF2505 domain-containing protein [Arachnia propionica]|nr:DUF2505 domain-containing protein [Arachnia propionica]MDO5083923.1 DUF2505 domain-containing protein [Arachnia propionica]
MKLNYRHEFNGTTDEVVALFRNPEFIDDIARHAGALEHTVDIDGETTHLKLSLPAPESISKFFGKGIKIAQSFAWSQPDEAGNRQGIFTVDIAGAPVAVEANALLSPAGENASVAQYDGELEVKIPLVGKKVEGMVEPMIKSAFAGIERRARAWLSKS